MPNYTKQVQTGTNRDGSPLYTNLTKRYKANNARRPKKTPSKSRGGSPASNYKPKSSAASFFTALAIPTK